MPEAVIGLIQSPEDANTKPVTIFKVRETPVITLNVGIDMKQVESVKPFGTHITEAGKVLKDWVKKSPKESRG